MNNIPTFYEQLSIQVIEKVKKN